MSVASPVAPPPPPPVEQGLARDTLTISGWNALSRVTGFIRVLAVGGALGATYLGNTYHSANLVSTLTFELLAAGLLSAPLVPAFVGLMARGRDDEAQRLAGTLLGISLVVLGPLVVLMSLASGPLMQLLTAGVDDAAVRAREVRLGSFLLWFFLPQMLLYAAGSVASALLNARRRFAAAAFAPVANNVVVIATMVAFAGITTGSGRSLDIGVAPRLVLGLGTTAGVVAMAAVPLVALLRAGVRLRPRLDLSHPALPAVARAGAWGAALVAGVQVLLGVTVVLANQVEGGVVAHQIALTFFLLPFALVAHPVLTALYPRLSTTAHEQRWDDFTADLAGGLRRMILLVVPAAALLAVLADPLLGLVRLGALDSGGAGLAARVVAAYSLGLGGYSAFQFLSRAATAAGHPRLPALVGGAMAVGGSLLMVAGVASTDGDSQVVVLGLAHSLAMTVGALVLGGLLQRRLGRPLRLAAQVGRAVVVAGVVAGAGAAAANVFAVGGRGGALVDLAVAGPLALCAGVAAMWAVGVPEVADVLRWARRGQMASGSGRAPGLRPRSDQGDGGRAQAHVSQAAGAPPGETAATGPPVRSVVALVPAKDSAGSVGSTVVALRALAGVDEVVVVDDGSVDRTAAVALAAGARVVRLEVNVGKGGAVRAGIAATPTAEVYLLADADLGATAGEAVALLSPVLSGEADMAVAVLPSPGRKAGLGGVRRLAAAGIARATGGRFRPRAPLSGQRAVRGDLLRSLPLADRFGLETAMSIDAVRAGACVVEIDVDMDHRHTGRSVAGFRHRGGQGVQIVQALWPRLTTTGQRVGAIAVAFALVAGGALWSGGRREPSSQPSSARAAKVIVFGVPKLGWDDVGTGAMPVLDRLVRGGAVAATSVRTLAGRPTTAEGYATLGAGNRVRADSQAGQAFEVGTALEGGTAGEALRRRSGRARSAEVAVVGAPATQRLNDGRHLSSRPGALGDALRRAGRRAAVVGNADIAPPRLPRRPVQSRPAAAAAMDSGGWVAAGAVGPHLLIEDRLAPFGLRSDPAAVGRAVEDAMARADLVVVDPGDMDRAAEFAAVSTPAAAAAARRRALASTDHLLGEVSRAAGADSLLLVVSVVPPGKDWHLTPMVASGKGVQPGYLHSPSVRRLGVVTLTDVAPTVLDALGVPVAEGMIGQPLRYHPGRADLGALREVDRDAGFREGLYYPTTVWFIGLQALAYLVAMVALARLRGRDRVTAAVRWAVLAVAAWPLATFVLRAVPDVAVLGPASVLLLLSIDAAIVAVAWRSRRRPLAPLAWICGATVALLVADLATGGHLQASSLLGYSYHTAARFTGLGNSAFAVLAATAILAAALHVHHAPRRREAVVTAGCLLALVAMADGAPSLGSDVGGILTLVPVFALTLLALCGRRVSWRGLAAAAGAAVVVVAMATGVDLLRPPGERTHLGATVARIAEEGWEPLTTTLGRKVSSNLRSFRSPWAWVVPIIGGYLLAILSWARGWHRLLPEGSALRAGALGVVAAGVLGYAVNDSGVVVTGLVFVYLGPFVTLLALRPEPGPPVVLEPPDAASGIQPRSVPGVVPEPRLATGR